VLILGLRCFGDKGDVEDITEGKAGPLPFTGYLVLGDAVSSSLGALPSLTSLFLADIISTVEFDHTGNYLATGDKGGRVVLFERNETVSVNSSHFSPSSILPQA